VYLVVLSFLAIQLTIFASKRLAIYSFRYAHASFATMPVFSQKS